MCSPNSYFTYSEEPNTKILLTILNFIAAYNEIPTRWFKIGLSAFETPLVCKACKRRLQEHQPLYQIELTASPLQPHRNLHPLLWSGDCGCISTKSWGGEESQLWAKVCSHTNLRRHRDNALFAHDRPLLSQVKQQKPTSFLACSAPRLSPFSPGKGCWGNSTFTGLWAPNRQEPTLNAGSSVTPK